MMTAPPRAAVVADAEPRMLPCQAVRGFGPRLRGLLGHPPPAPGTGWWFARCASVHTFGMRYAIDVVFLSCQGQVLHVVPHLAPWRACWHPGARDVIELAAGEAARLALVPGSRVVPLAADAEC